MISYISINERYPTNTHQPMVGWAVPGAPKKSRLPSLPSHWSNHHGQKSQLNPMENLHFIQWEKIKQSLVNNETINPYKSPL